MRAGAHALTLLATPLNVHALQALEEEPMSVVDLRRALGAPPQTTMRAYLKSLADDGVISTSRRIGRGSSAECELGLSGHALLTVADTVGRWLALNPDGPVELGSPEARNSLKALVGGWSTAIVRVLAARPLALTELNQVLTRVSYPSLERRLTAMRLAGQIVPTDGPGRRNPYAITEWLRKAVIPIVAAARWEREHLPEKCRPMSRLDIEAAFLLALPLVEIDSRFDGVARIAVDLTAGGEYRLVGVHARIAEGRVLSCKSDLRGPADAFITGSVAAWMRTLLEGEFEGLEMGGDVELGRELAAQVHGALAGALQLH